MTAYQAVRARPAAATPRRRVSSPSRARRRTHPAGMVLAAVVLSLMLGLIYLAQTIELGATRYEVQQLVRGREDLARQVQTIETTMLRWTAEPLVIERAQQAGLVPLAAKVRLPDR